VHQVENLNREGAEVGRHRPVFAGAVPQPDDVHHLVGKLGVEGRFERGAELILAPEHRDIASLGIPAPVGDDAVAWGDDGHFGFLPAFASAEHAAVARHDERFRRPFRRGKASLLQRQSAVRSLGPAPDPVDDPADEVRRNGHRVVDAPALRGFLEAGVHPEVEDAALHRVGHLAFLGQLELDIPRVEAVLARAAVVVVARKAQLPSDGEEVTDAVLRLHRHGLAALRARLRLAVFRRKSGDGLGLQLFADVMAEVLGHRLDVLELEAAHRAAAGELAGDFLHQLGVAEVTPLRSVVGGVRNRGLPGLSAS
jgi:hypothetical protein